MKYLFPFFLSFLIISCSTNVDENEVNKLPAAMPAVEYPETKKIDHITDYHGTEVNDPYQWLENEEGEDVKEWVDAQNEVTNKFLEHIPFRNNIEERLTEIWNYEKRSAPFKEGDAYFYYRNDGIQNQSVLYKAKSLEEEGKVLIDPNTFSEDGTAALTGTYFSKDGKYLVYAVSHAGSDWKEFFIKDVETGKDLDDHLKWIKFSGASWFKDGFFYSRYQEPEEGQVYTGKNLQQRLYYHQLGTKQEEDLLVYEDMKHPEWSFSASVSEEEDYLFLYTYASTSGNQLHYIELQYEEATPVKQFLQKLSKQLKDPRSLQAIADDFDHDHHIAHVEQDEFILHTNLDAPNYKLVKVKGKTSEELVSEKEHVLQSAQVINGKLILKYLENVKSEVYITDMETMEQKKLTLPGLGLVSGISGKKDQDHFYYSLVSYTQPGTIYKYTFDTGESNLYFKPSIDFDSEDYVTKQVFYKSKDGTSIPMFITHKKGLEINGNTPTFLFGYGGFNISYTPEFRLDRTVFLENGGIYAVANIRGGGEFGEEWHKAGTKENKQNVFDDFIAACEFLINEGYTNKDKLAIHGRSNGGLLVGAVMTQRPDLMKVAIPKVGVLDMLKFHKFTIGKYWVTDYGCSDIAEDFDYLYKYSPVHNVKENVAYPATFIVTGDHDDRVVPAHSYKFTAQLQAKNKGDNPILIRIDKAGGHGSGKPVAKQIEEFADTWAFVFYNLGMSYKR